MKFRVLLEPRYGASYQQLLALAQAAEEAGFDGFFRGDHYLGIDAADPAFAPTDSWTTLAGLAVQTRRIRLGTLVTAATFRQPGNLAVIVATVQAMSGGRAELGIGAAWYEREHESFGIGFPPIGERFGRLAEQLAVITGLWGTPAGERFSFHGEHYRIEDCANFPSLAGVGRPRIILGVTGPRRGPALAARFGRRVQLRPGAGRRRPDRELPPHLRRGRAGPGDRQRVGGAAGVLRGDRRRGAAARGRARRGRCPAAGARSGRHARRRAAPDRRTGGRGRGHRVLPRLRHRPRPPASPRQRSPQPGRPGRSVIMTMLSSPRHHRHDHQGMRELAG